MNGRNIFMGYLNMKDKTLEAFDDELWVRSGDIGKKDNDGFLFITGRIKGTLYSENWPTHLQWTTCDDYWNCSVLHCELRSNVK